MTAQQSAPPVNVMMGSSSDWEMMRHAVDMLTQFGIPSEAQIILAHRMPDDMFGYAETARGRGLCATIAGADRTAHLPGIIAAKTVVPVLGMPVPSKYLRGGDSLPFVVQMSKGIPVSTFVVGEAGAANAALVAITIIAATDSALTDKFEAFRAQQTEVAHGMTLLVHGA